MPSRDEKRREEYRKTKEADVTDYTFCDNCNLKGQKIMSNTDNRKLNNRK